MKSRWFLTVLFGAALLLPSVGWGVETNEVWDSTFEGSPGDSDPAAAGAGKIRVTREETGDRGSVEHYWGDNDDTDDDNGLQRLGSARCFMSDAAPTTLSDTSADHVNDGSVAGETDLDNSAFGSDDALEDDIGHGRCWIDLDGADNTTTDECVADGDPDACCTDTDTGTCGADDNKLYIYVGVAGDGGGAGEVETGYESYGWVEVLSQHDIPGDFALVDAAGVRVKAGAPNILYNGDFDIGSATGDGCNTPTTTTDQPIGWTIGSGAPTFDYIAGSVNTDQGAGCAVEVTDTAGGDQITQLLSNLKGLTTYRVTAQVLEGGTDECTLSTSGAATDVTGMVSVDDTEFAQLDGFFITGDLADDVTIALTNTASGDICTWDHIGVYRQEDVEVPDNAVTGIFDTFLTSEATNAGCAASEDPDPCCTGAGTGTCTIDVGGSFVDVPELSITWTPPTEGWTVQIGGQLSVGCEGTCAGVGTDEGYHCQLEKGGTAISGTVLSRVGNLDIGGSSDWMWTEHFTAIENNPVAGTEIVYTMACRDEGTITADTFLYNKASDGDAITPDSNLWIMAYPPH